MNETNNSMEKMIRNLIQELHTFNSSLKKRALKEEVFQDLEKNFTALHEAKNRINELISNHNNRPFNDPNEVNRYLTELRGNIIIFDSFFNEIRWTLTNCIKQHDLLIKPYNPIGSMKSKKTNEFTIKGDAYILEAVGPYLITNDGYTGVSIFDHQLNLVKALSIIGNLVIDHIYKHTSENKVIIYDQDHRRFILVDLDRFSFNIIPLTSIDPDIVFSPIYQWESNEIVLIASKGEFFVCNTQSGKIKKMPKKVFGITYPELYGCWNYSFGYGRTYYFIDKKEFAVDFQGEEPISIFDYNDVPLQAIARPNLDIHDIILSDDKICFVSEEAIQIIDKTNNTLLFLRAPANHEFTRARLIKEKNKTILVTLSGHYAPLGSESKLITYELESS